MSLISLGFEDKQYLALNFPSLQITEVGIQGRVTVTIIYDFEEDKFQFIYPNTESAIKGEELRCSLNIHIDLTEASNGLPIISNPNHELLDRFLYLHSLAIPNINKCIDMHIYSDGKLCLCSDIEVLHLLPSGFNIKNYFERLLLPFLYYQEYLFKNRKEPWTGRSHGDLGTLESILNMWRNGYTGIYELNYFKKKSVVNQAKRYARPSSKQKCLCGSREQFRRCHPNALLGLKILWENT